MTSWPSGDENVNSQGSNSYIELANYPAKVNIIWWSWSLEKKGDQGNQSFLHKKTTYFPWSPIMNSYSEAYTLTQTWVGGRATKHRSNQILSATFYRLQSHFCRYPILFFHVGLCASGYGHVMPPLLIGEGIHSFLLKILVRFILTYY